MTPDETTEIEQDRPCLASHRAVDEVDDYLDRIRHFLGGSFKKLMGSKYYVSRATLKIIGVKRNPVKFSDLLYYILGDDPTTSIEEVRDRLNILASVDNSLVITLATQTLCVFSAQTCLEHQEFWLALISPRQGALGLLGIINGLFREPGIHHRRMPPIAGHLISGELIFLSCYDMVNWMPGSLRLSLVWAD